MQGSVSEQFSVPHRTGRLVCHNILENKTSVLAINIIDQMVTVGQTPPGVFDFLESLGPVFKFAAI